jgi:hypothetical protein
MDAFPQLSAKALEYFLPSFVAVLICQEKKGCSRIAKTHNTRVKLGSAFTGDIM